VGRQLADLGIEAIGRNGGEVLVHLPEH
jgi:hypothetical protein